MAKPRVHTKKSRAAVQSKPVVKKRPSNLSKDELACILIDIGGQKALLPKSCMNAILKYQKPEPFETAPEWLLGSVEWKNWQVPVISFSRLSGLGSAAKSTNSHIIMIKSLASNKQMPFIGVVINTAPISLNLENKDVTEDPEATPALGVFSTVKLAGKNIVLIPDLDRLNQLVAHAAYGALPITQIL